MTDIIRKAVELADGWGTLSSEKLVGVKSTIGKPLSINWLKEQATLDALAAQLVRQVDALCPHYNIYYHKWLEGKQKQYTQLIGLRSSIMSYHEVLVEVEGNDRTMNTIKVIVDSGVLE